LDSPSEKRERGRIPGYDHAPFPGYDHASFSPRFLMGFCSHGPFEYYLPNLKFVASPVPEIIGGTQKIGPTLDAPTLPFLHNFSWACVRMYRPNLHSVALAVPEIIAIAVLGWGCEPQSWGRGGRRGSGMIPFDRAFVTSYRLSILRSNVSSIFTRFRDIAAFALQHATFSHPTSSLPKISRCSPRSRWMAFGLRRAKLLG